jgi:hypothetical protein
VYSQEEVLELVELIYTAAGDPTAWVAVLKSLSDLLDGCAGTIHHQHLTSHESNVAAVWNLDESRALEYVNHYAALNPWMTTRTKLITQGSVLTGQMLCPDNLLDRNECYQDFWLPMGDLPEEVQSSGQMSKFSAWMRACRERYQSKLTQLVLTAEDHVLLRAIGRAQSRTNYEQRIQQKR